MESGEDAQEGGWPDADVQMCGCHVVTQESGRMIRLDLVQPQPWRAELRGIFQTSRIGRWNAYTYRNRESQPMGYAENASMALFSAYLSRIYQRYGLLSLDKASCFAYFRWVFVLGNSSARS